MSSDLATLQRTYRRLGWTIERTSKHLMWRGPNGERVVTSFSPSDHRALHRMKADLRRAAMRHR
jgi:hypothetical protein